MAQPRFAYLALLAIFFFESHLWCMLQYDPMTRILVDAMRDHAKSVISTDKFHSELKYVLKQPETPSESLAVTHMVLGESLWQNAEYKQAILHLQLGVGLREFITHQNKRHLNRARLNLATAMLKEVLPIGPHLCVAEQAKGIKKLLKAIVLDYASTLDSCETEIYDQASNMIDCLQQKLP